MTLIVMQESSMTIQYVSLDYLSKHDWLPEIYLGQYIIWDETGADTIGTSFNTIFEAQVVAKLYCWYYLEGGANGIMNLDNIPTFDSIQLTFTKDRFLPKYCYHLQEDGSKKILIYHLGYWKKPSVKQLMNDFAGQNIKPYI